MRQERRSSLEKDELLNIVLVWINGNKDFLEKADLPAISIKNMELYERDTETKFRITKKGQKNVLRAVRKLESQGLIREDNVGNILVTKKGWLKAEGLVEVIDYSKTREKGIYEAHISSEEREQKERERRRRIVETRKLRLEG